MNHNIYLLSLKNSELLQELAQRIKNKRIRLTQRLEGQCIGGLLSWDEEDKYWLNLVELDDTFKNLRAHWHSLKTEPEENQEKVIFNCQECQTPIKMSQPKKGGLKVLEFYGKWTGQGHNLVCQKCLESKETK